ncbi:hypothetical protein [Clostridium sp.]|uniref:hypothetical protein n=1 Tax=Clostridium sp. TaxID=1506 RepID=UPI001A56A98C|nr:hypothetical protein [Clostridium sp.]MBK5241709.1 hypothetical protein [Clostridium sp.]
MSENKKENEENKEIITDDNSEIINKMYSNNNASENNNPKTEYSSRKSKSKDIDTSEKYIKEMRLLADKNEFKNNIIVLALGIVVVSIILFSIFMNSSLMKPKADVVADEQTNKEVSEVVTKPTVDSASTIVAETQNDIYEYLNLESNRVSSLEKALSLNNGNKTGITVYLLSEILRANNYDIPTNTSTVNGLLERLTSMGWEKNTDFNELEKGDICFTTDLPEEPGSPSHTYIFMSWLEDGKTDYANIVDGQIQEFDKVLHERSISISTPQKDKFSFFLRK